jgi:multiple sugar transport system permease protein
MRTPSWVPALYVGPAVLIMAAACLYPVISAFQLGLYDWSMGTPWSEARWTGLQNFASAFSNPRVWASLWTTLRYRVLQDALYLAHDDCAHRSGLGLAIHI